MSGWIKIEKDLETDPRVRRMAKALAETWELANASHGAPFEMCNSYALPAVTLVCGALARLWILADSHAREDDTLDMGEADIDEHVGIPNFCKMLPDCWLRIIDDSTVELPNFHAHNGVEAKKRALTQKRVARHRDKTKPTSVTPRNASSLPDQDQTKTIEREASASSPSRNSSPQRGKKSGRVPDDFRPDLDWARQEVPDMDAEREVQKFRDWEFKAAKSDWPATWRTWVRRARDKGDYARVNGSKGGDRGLPRFNPDQPH